MFCCSRVCRVWPGLAVSLGLPIPCGDIVRSFEAPFFPHLDHSVSVMLADGLSELHQNLQSYAILPMVDRCAAGTYYVVYWSPLALALASSFRL